MYNYNFGVVGKKYITKDEDQQVIKDEEADVLSSDNELNDNPYIQQFRDIGVALAALRSITRL